MFNLINNNLPNELRRALILCPHPDDELGCAGLILRLLLAKVEIMYVALSKCEESVPEPYPKNILEIECRLATGRLGIPSENVQIFDFPVRHFPENRQDILEHLVTFNRQYEPELILLPSSYDNHQDHATIHKEGFRAFKNASILGYELPQNLVSFSNTAFVILTEEQIELKIFAMSSYQSQVFRPYTSPDFIRSLAKVRGVQCKAEFAEAYEVIRLIL